MNNFYCMACGRKNDVGSNFCSKCGKPFGSTQVSTEKNKEEPPPTTKQKKKTSPLEPDNITISSENTTNHDIIIEASESSEEDGEGEGVSINYCPKVRRLEVDFIESDEVPKYKLGDIIEKESQQ